MPLGIFGQALLTALLHHTWYSAVSYVKKLKLDTTSKCKRLSRLYILKNYLQISITIVAFIVLFVFILDDGRINRNFGCSSNLLDPPLQCIYNATGVNNVFLIFYGFMSIFVIVAAVYGLMDIFVKSFLFDHAKTDRECSNCGAGTTTFFYCIFTLCCLWLCGCCKCSDNGEKDWPLPSDVYITEYCHPDEDTKKSSQLER